jgi:hypothetical protein
MDIYLCVIDDFESTKFRSHLDLIRLGTELG